MGKAQVYKEQLIIPTYELLEDDVNPIFDKHLNPYPYTMQNKRANEKEEKAYDAVVLENEYLKIIVLPSLGGRVYSAVDKRNGQEFLYTNRVIKPRMIGTRGAWFSGGMEFNFPISHSPTTMDRVNYLYHEHPDGSASVVLGNIEQISFMNWKVELKLYPGKAYMEQSVDLTNPTPFENRFYFWTNTAVQYNENLQLIYPFDWGINHLDQKYLRWPFYKEMDFRNASDIPFSYEMFGKLMNHNYFGIYNHAKDFGLVHYANRKKLKGAKFFSWGNDNNGRAWNQSLTDDDSQYIEIQSGPFESQMVYKFLKPHQRVTWNEYWYPISKMNGFKYADKEVAVNYEVKEKEIVFDLAANETLIDSELILGIREKQYQSKVNLTPERNETIRFELNQPMRDDAFTLNLYCGSRHLISLGGRDEFSGEYPDHSIYEDSRSVMGERDENNVFKMAEFKESLGLTGEAVSLYEQNLKQFPYCTLTTNRLGQLYLKSMQYEKAEGCFIRTLRYDNRNSKARFHLAMTEKIKGNLQRARRLWMDIAADAEYYKPSLIELTKVNIALGYYKDAQSLLEGCENFSGYLYGLGSIAYRKGGLAESARTLFADVQQTSEFLHTEKYLLERSGSAKKEWLTFTQSDEKVLLPIALDYIDLRLYEDAEEIVRSIRNPGMKTKWTLVEIGRRLGSLDTTLFQSALSDSLDYVFVNETRIVQTLIDFKEQDDTGIIDYLLGTFYFSVSRKQDAMECYLSAYEKGLRYTVLLHNLGYIYVVHEHDPQMGERFFAEDVAVNQGRNEDTLVYLDKIYAEQGEQEKRKSIIPYMENAKSKSLVLLSLVDSYKQFGEEEKALAILENEEFENWEGKELSGTCFRDFMIHMALKQLEKDDLQGAKQWIDRADQYPANLNYGDSLRTPLSELNYHRGIIYRRIGDIEAASQYFKAGYFEMTKDDIFRTKRSEKFSLLCLKELNKSF